MVTPETFLFGYFTKASKQARAEKKHDGETVAAGFTPRATRREAHHGDDSWLPNSWR